MTGRTFHAAAWAAWLAGAVTTVAVVTNPVASALTLAALAAVAGTFSGRGSGGRSFSLMLRIGAVVIVVRVLLFALTGHTGPTTLFTLPRVQLPALLGGLELGGRITGEVVAQSAAEGLRLAAFLACFGVFLSVTDTYRVLRLLPRFLASAGLVVTIALAFVPTLARSVRDIRDAQRLRGHRVRGLRGMIPLVVPVLASALDRSIALGESMESRGFGRTDPSAQRTEAAARAGLLVSLIALAVAGAMVLYGRGHGAIRVALMAGAAAGTAASLRALSAAVTRTRLRAERPDRWDRVVVAGAAALFAASLAAGAAGAGRWYAYPSLSWPDAGLAPVALAALTAFPVAVDAMRARWLRRASAPAPGAPIPEEAAA